MTRTIGYQDVQSLLNRLIQENIISYSKIDDSYYIASDALIKNLPISLGFEHISIAQKKNICSSRLDTDISSEFMRGVKLEVPLIAANMSTVVDADFCIRLRELGALGIMHRALSKDVYLAEVKKIAERCDLVAVSIGVGEDQFELCRDLISAGANIITIDIAHGYSEPVIALGKKIKTEFKHIKLIVGNTINVDMMYEVDGFADAVKCGIGQGKSCETKNTAGCTERQFSAVLKFKEVSRRLGLPVISDGGIREPADFTKAIAAGANSVMAGSIFCRCPESAADIIEIDGARKKIYQGMSSRAVQEQWRCGLKKGTCPEGKAIYLDLGEPLEALIERYTGALRSGITYAGAKDIQSLQDQVEFVRLI